MRWKVKSQPGGIRIGDLAASSGLTTKAIPIYEQAGPLPAQPRTPGGYRDYPEQTTRRLAFIRDAQGAGLTLAEIRSVLTLRDAGASPCDVTAHIDRHLADIDRRVAELRATRTALRALAERAAATDPADCTDAGICRILIGAMTRRTVSAVTEPRARRRIA